MELFGLNLIFVLIQTNFLPYILNILKFKTFALLSARLLGYDCILA